MRENKIESKLTPLSKFIYALGNKDYRIRESALESLAEIGRDKAIPYLMKALDDKNHFVKVRAIEYLQQFRVKKAANKLIELLKKAKDALLCTDILEYLADIGHKKAIPIIREMLKSKNSLVRGYAAQALGDLKDNDSLNLLQRLVSQERSGNCKVRIYYALYRLGENKILSEIIKRLDSGEYRVRCVTAYILADLTNKSNFSKILKLLKDAYKREKNVAVRSSLKENISKINRRFSK